MNPYSNEESIANYIQDTKKYQNYYQRIYGVPQNPHKKSKQHEEEQIEHGPQSLIKAQLAEKEKYAPPKIYNVNASPSRAANPQIYIKPSWWG